MFLCKVSNSFGLKQGFALSSLLLWVQTAGFRSVHACLCVFDKDRGYLIHLCVLLVTTWLSLTHIQVHLNAGYIVEHALQRNTISYSRSSSIG